MQDRTGGAYYRATWEGTLASDPPWAVVVSTWDEWKGQTQIEPGGDDGDLYLQMTRQYADQWKGSEPPPRPEAPDDPGSESDPEQ